MKAKLYKGTIALALATTIASCGGSNNKSVNSTSEAENGITNFEVIQSVKSLKRSYICEGAPAHFNDSAEVYSTVRIAVEWPEKMSDYNLKTLQDSLLTAIFDKPGQTLEASMIASEAQPEGSDLFKMKEIDSIPSDEPAMVYSRDMIASVITFSPLFISYQIMTATYNGGAHGMTESTYVNYDFSTGKVLTYDNAFTPESEPKLLQAIKDNLMTRYNVSSMEELNRRGIFTDQIYVSKNFYLQGYEVIFHYNPYDIAPYSEGSINVRVPYFQISDCLTPEITRLLTDNDF